jgi:membrane fusion protein (multidrug efflux system)
MKNLIPVLIFVTALSACSSEKKSDMQVELDSLVKVQSDINDRIAVLKNELAKNDSNAAEKATLVEVEPAAPRSFRHYIEVQAKVDGDEDVQVSAETMGIITAVLVKAGDKVTKGQVLITLDDKAMQQSLAEMRSQLELVTSLYNKQKSLWDQKIGSEVQYIQAKANKDAAEKRMAGMQEQWNMTRIKSPINGTVDAVNVKIGQALSPGMAAVHVVNLTSLKVKAEVAESFISKVRKGNDVLIYFPDIDKEVKGKVDYSGSAINNVNRTFNVEVRLNPKEGEFHPNMVAILKIIDYTSENAMVVPVKTIQNGREGSYVFIASMEGGKTVAKRQTVKPGISYNGMTEIKEGLKQGDKVIMIGYSDLVEGEEVKF